MKCVDFIARHPVIPHGYARTRSYAVHPPTRDSRAPWAGYIHAYMPRDGHLNVLKYLKVEHVLGKRDKVLNVPVTGRPRQHPLRKLSERLQRAKEAHRLRRSAYAERLLTLRHLRQSSLCIMVAMTTRLLMAICLTVLQYSNNTAY